MLPRVLLERRVERVIVASWFHRAVTVPSLLRSHVRALANCFTTFGDYATIVPDEAGGGYLATRRLLNRQLAPVGFLNMRPAIPAGPGRLKGYKQAFREAGVPYDSSLVITTKSAQAHEGFELTKRLLGERPDLRLLFCGNDRTAMGALRSDQTERLAHPRRYRGRWFRQSGNYCRRAVPRLDHRIAPSLRDGCASGRGRS